VKARSETRRPSFFWFLAALVLPLMNLAVRFRFHHPERMPQSGAFVLAPNHYSEIDPLVIGVVMWKLGRMPRYLTKASLFTVPVLGWFLRKTGQIPVERGAAARGNGPLDAAERLADQGLGVIIYPEGSLTRDPELWPMRGKTGAVRMALEADVPLIPVASWGAQLILPRYAKRISFFPRKHVVVKYGDAVDLSAYRGRNLDAAGFAEATTLLMNDLTALVEDLRGEKAPEQRWDPSQHDQRETGRFE
jgi:1-acyl-sn-glycerol-3-phosphate acyltransferase